MISKRKIYLSTLILFLIITQNIIAQKKAGDIRLGYGFNGGIPFNDAFNYSLGVDGRLQYDTSLRTSLLLTTGYTHLFNKDGDLGFAPVKLGFKSYVGADKLYVLGELGAGFGTKEGMGTTFLWSPGVGLATKHVDISLRYENYNKFNTGQVCLRLAYGYKIN